MSLTDKSDQPKEDITKVTEKEKAKVPSKVLLEKWTSSINALLTDDEGVNAFRNFLKETETESGEFTRYLDFLLECQKYREQFLALEQSANNIFIKYLEFGADFEIGCDQGDEVQKQLKKGIPAGKDLFVEAQTKIKQTIADGHYVNFCEYLKEKYKI